MRLLALLRVSSEDREAWTGTETTNSFGSIETQREKIDLWAQVHDHEILHWYCDEDVSGTIPLELRPQGGRLLNEAPERQAEGVVVYRLDRLGRSFSVIFNGIELLQNAGLAFLSATEQFDNVTPSGRAMLGMLATFAGFERDTLLQRCGDGKRKWAKAGCWLGGIVPYGYTLATIEKRRFLVPSTEILAGCTFSEATVIEWVFQWTAEDCLSSHQVAHRLAALNVPTHQRLTGDRPGMKRKGRSHGTWRHSQVRRILANSTYKGLHVFGNRQLKSQKIEPQPRQVAAIVSEELWEKAYLQAERNRERSGRPSGNPYLLKGLLICSHCQRHYIATLYPFGKRVADGNHYYKCGGKHLRYTAGSQYLKDLHCRNRAIAGVPLEEKLWRDVEYVILNQEEVIKRITGDRATPARQIEACRERVFILDRLLQDIEEQNREIITMRVKRDLTQAEFQEQRDRLTAERASALAERAVAEQTRQDIEDRQIDADAACESLADLREALATGSMTFEDRQMAVRRFVKRIEIDAPTTPGRSPNPEPVLKVVWKVQAILALISASMDPYCFELGKAAEGFSCIGA